MGGRKGSPKTGRLVIGSKGKTTKQPRSNERRYIAIQHNEIVKETVSLSLQGLKAVGTVGGQGGRNPTASKAKGRLVALPIYPGSVGHIFQKSKQGNPGPRDTVAYQAPCVVLSGDKG